MAGFIPAIHDKNRELNELTAPWAIMTDEMYYRSPYL